MSALFVTFALCVVIAVTEAQMDSRERGTVQEERKMAREEERGRRILEQRRRVEEMRRRILRLPRDSRRLDALMTLELIIPPEDPLRSQVQREIRELTLELQRAQQAKQKQ